MIVCAQDRFWVNFSFTLTIINNFDSSYQLRYVVKLCTLVLNNYTKHRIVEVCHKPMNTVTCVEFDGITREALARTLESPVDETQLPISMADLPRITSLLKSQPLRQVLFTMSEVDSQITTTVPHLERLSN